MPSIWDDVRRTIDERANIPRQFILAGYTQLKTDLSKTNSQQEVHHSGAGWKNPEFWKICIFDSKLLGKYAIPGL